MNLSSFFNGWFGSPASPTATPSSARSKQSSSNVSGRGKQSTYTVSLTDNHGNFRSWTVLDGAVNDAEALAIFRYTIGLTDLVVEQIQRPTASAFARLATIASIPDEDH